MSTGTIVDNRLRTCDHIAYLDRQQVSTRRQPFRHATPAQRKTFRRAAVPSPKPSEQADVEYVDTWSDVQFINMCRRAYGGLAGWQSPRSWKDGSETYQGMLEVSRALMKVNLCNYLQLPTQQCWLTRTSNRFLPYNSKMITRVWIVTSPKGDIAVPYQLALQLRVSDDCVWSTSMTHKSAGHAGKVSQ